MADAVVPMHDPTEADAARDAAPARTLAAWRADGRASARASAAALRACARAGDAAAAVSFSPHSRRSTACRVAEHVRAAVLACSKAGAHADALELYVSASLPRATRAVPTPRRRGGRRGRFADALRVVQEMDERGWRVEERHLRNVRASISAPRGDEGGEAALTARTRASGGSAAAGACATGRRRTRRRRLPTARRTRATRARRGARHASLAAAAAAFWQCGGAEAA